MGFKTPGWEVGDGLSWEDDMPDRNTKSTKKARKTPKRSILRLVICWPLGLILDLISGIEWEKLKKRSLPFSGLEWKSKGDWILFVCVLEAACKDYISVGLSWEVERLRVEGSDCFLMLRHEGKEHWIGWILDEDYIAAKFMDEASFFVGRPASLVVCWQFFWVSLFC